MTSDASRLRTDFAAPQTAPLKSATGPSLALAIYLGLGSAIALYLWWVIGPFTRFPGSMVDARFNQVVLEHLWLWATGRADSLSDPAYFYPYRDGLYLSDTHFGSGGVYVLARALGASREVAFDVWWLGGMASTFAAALYVFGRFGLSRPAAAFGAGMFAFSLPMLAQDDHAQLIYRFPVPLATLACVEAIRTGRARALAALALWVSWQFLCSFYLGVFLLEWLAAFGALCWLQPSLCVQERRRASSPASDAILTLLAATASAGAGYMLWRHASVAHAFGIHRTMQEIEAAAPTWKSLLSQASAPSGVWLTSLLHQDTPFWVWEHQLFPGFGVAVLAAWAVWRGRGDAASAALARACLIAVAVLLLLAMDFGGRGVYRWLAELPGLNAIRSPGRVALVCAFPISWLAARGVRELSLTGAPADRLWLAAGLALSLLDVALFRADSTEIAAARARLAPVEAGLDAASLRARRAVLLRFADKSFQRGASDDLDAMIAAQDLGLATADGYSGAWPPGYARPRNCAAARDWIARMDDIPFKRAGAADAGARTLIVPLGACDGAAPAQ